MDKISPFCAFRGCVLTASIPEPSVWPCSLESLGGPCGLGPLGTLVGSVTPCKGLRIGGRGDSLTSDTDTTMEARPVVLGEVKRYSSLNSGTFERWATGMEVVDTDSKTFRICLTVNCTASIILH